MRDVWKCASLTREARSDGSCWLNIFILDKFALISRYGGKFVNTNSWARDDTCTALGCCSGRHRELLDYFHNTAAAVTSCLQEKCMDFYQKDSTGTKTTSENSVSRKPLSVFKTRRRNLGSEGIQRRKLYNIACCVCGTKNINLADACSGMTLISI